MTMTEEQIQQTDSSMPAVPEGITDADRIAGAKERWENCPLRDCKRDPELLYADFYLRDIRTNRLMCSACAVRVEMGYMAREVVKATDDKFYKGTQLDNLLVFIVMFVASLISAAISQFLGFFFIIPFFIGTAIGGSAAVMSRRLTKRRVSRQTPYFGIAGIIIGAVLASPAIFFAQTGILFLDTRILLNFNSILSAVGMAMASWGIFMRRI